MITGQYNQDSSSIEGTSLLVTLGYIKLIIKPSVLYNNKKESVDILVYIKIQILNI